MDDDDIEIRLGLAESYRQEMAQIYCEAFQGKLQPLVGSRDHGIAILEADLAPGRALAALMAGRLVGFAGLQYDEERFFAPRLSTFVRELGWLRGPISVALLRLFSSHYREGELFLDTLAVHPSSRGQGVGTRLLQAVLALARERGFDSVRLEVVDTNPGARRLYERLGFRAGKTRQYPYARRAAGFSTVTTLTVAIA